MSIKEIEFASANGRDTVKAWAYSPLGEPVAVVQLVHGFGEHSRRYLHMIDCFQQAGCVVYADDHIGHGKTGRDSDTMGDPHSKDYLTYVEDEKRLHDLAREDYPALPYFMFGHSWGSMITRAYAALYGEDLAGVMLCGVVSQMEGCVKYLNDPELKAAVEADPYQSAEPWFPKVFCNTTARYDDVKGPTDWIANDPRVVADHASDPFNTFSTTLQLLNDLVQLSGFIDNEEWAARLPKGLPAYLLAGDQDPCGNYGEGVYFTANLLARAGHKTTTRMYTGYRHEIHNELSIRDEVEAGLVEFIDSVIG